MPDATPPSAPLAPPESVGLCSERLQRLSARLQHGVDAGEIPGAVVRIERRGQVAYEQAFGVRDPRSGAPMPVDAVFRIASMTKPITSMAILMLAEQGRLAIGDPVAQYLPAFADLTVGRPVTGADGRTALVREPAARPMTVQDLLRHTSGLGYGFTGTHPVKRAYLDAQVGRSGDTNAELVAKLAQLPLIHPPGTVWEYGVSTDVLGRIVEVVSGQGLDAFVHAQICQPLGLADTGFQAPPTAAQRAAYPQPEGPARELPPVPDPLQALAFKSGGGGMVSTAQDYARLCRLWLGGGALGGVRLLSRKSMALMTSDHLPPDVAMGPDMRYFGAHMPSAEMGLGFGLGFAVRTHPGRNPHPGSVGDFFWTGIYGTCFWVDPQEELIALLMMQSMAERLRYRTLLRQLVYQALL